MKDYSRILLLWVFLSIPAMGMAQNNPRNIQYNWETDTAEKKVPLHEFTVLLERDGIPPIESKGGLPRGNFSSI